MSPEDSDDRPARVVEQLTDSIQRFPWGEAVIAGGGAFLSGYLVFVAVVVATASSLEGSIRGVLVLIGFIYYSAHNVPARLDSTGFGTFDWLSYVAQPTTPDPNLPVAVYYLLPVLVLLLAGGAFVYVYGDRDGDPIDALTTGVAMSLGYVLVALLGTLLVRSPSTLGTPARVDQLQTLIFCSIYPLGFAMFGAAVVQFVRYVRAELT